MIHDNSGNSKDMLSRSQMEERIKFIICLFPMAIVGQELIILLQRMKSYSPSVWSCGQVQGRCVNLQVI